MPSRSVVNPSSFTPSRRTFLSTAAAGAALAVGVAGAPAARAADKTADKTKAPAERHVRWTGWTDTQVVPGPFSGTRTYVDPFDTSGTSRTYDVATWTSPVVTPGFGLTELVASWNATTPGGSWVEVAVTGTSAGATTKEYVLGRWAARDPEQGGSMHRTSVAGQGDTVATVYTDTLATRSGYSLTDYRLTVRLMRPAGSTDAPTLTSIGAMASALPDTKKVPRSANGPAVGTVLDVPTYSQERHVGHFPQWDNGGEAWCSPTSTSMVVAYWGHGPTAQETAWVTVALPDETDPQVDFTARNVFDYTYDGAGNWPFNAAYAATRGDLRGFVTRLRSLREAEEFIAAGIPLVASVSFKKGELTGAGYGTNGHLMVIVGFTPDGDVVCNDPASHLLADDAKVRVTYDRQEFENVWVPHSGGIVYVIHPVGTPLPPAPTEANW